MGKSKKNKSKSKEEEESRSHRKAPKVPELGVLLAYGIMRFPTLFDEFPAMLVGKLVFLIVIGSGPNKSARSYGQWRVY